MHSLHRGSYMATFSFDSFGFAIVRATATADRASCKARDIVAQSFAQFLDSCTVAGVARDEAGVKSIGTAIRECQAFLDAVALGTIEKNTVTNYAQSAMRAYYHEAAWYASAFVSEDKGGLPVLPWSKGAAKTSTARAGTVSTTDNAALLATIRKAIEQATLLNRDVIRSILIDAAVEIDDTFTV